MPSSTPPAEDTRSLEQAILEYRRSGQPDDLGVFADHLVRYPNSAYRLSLVTNMGLVHYHYGFFSRALEDWEAVWTARASAEGTPAKAIVDRALGELIRMHARLGHIDQVAALLQQLEGEGRVLIGQATEAVTGAREGLWKMRNEPGVAFLCGPKAVANILDVLTPASPKRELVDAYRSGPHGVSLGEVEQLAAQAGLPWRAMFRQPGQPIPIPSIVHWKVNHYAALVGEEGERYHLKDPTFGKDLWISKAALESESSGYFLVPESNLSKGWRLASALEARSVYGMGNTGGSDPGGTSPNDPPACPRCNSEGSKGSARYSVHGMLVSLHIEDTPVAYRPARGPIIKFVVAYNQREAGQPSTPTYSNLGPKWTHNWLAYVRDDPTTPSANVTEFTLGGGSRDHSGFVAATNTFGPQRLDRAVLKRTSASPIAYELTNPDGSKLVFGFSNGGTSAGRQVFLTQVIDPVGNTVTLSYDAQRRLTSITDATGRVSTLTYTSSADPLRITGFIDAAGRSAAIAYDTNGRVSSITDAVGMVSSFEYAAAPAGDFINKMTTPYGDTTFAASESGTTRSLLITDPLGKTEKIEYRHTAPGIPYSEVSDVPSGMPIFNEYINARNTFYWDKEVYAQHGGTDYTKARIQHWLHTPDLVSTTGRRLESTKEPLDRRVWFAYPDQPAVRGSAAIMGSIGLPTFEGRVDTASRIKKYEYNAQGNKTRETDEVGRDTYYDYASNGIDLMTVRQKTSSSPLTYSTVSSFTYNTQHQPLTTTDAAGKTTTHEYNSYGQLTKLTNALNEVTRFEYGADSYLARVVNANNQTQVSYLYDSAGNVTSETDSEGLTRTHTYDGLNRRLTTTWPDGTAETIQYDKLDVASVTDRLNVTKTYLHDAVRNLITVTEPVGIGVNKVNQFTYYANGLLKTLQDGNGNVTTWERDIQGRVTKKLFADGKGETYTYDAVGRLETRKDALNQVTTYSYAGDSRLQGRTYTAAVNPTPNVTFTWDTYFPRLNAMTDTLGSTTNTTNYGYGALGANGALRLTLDDGPWANDGISYAYDALGRLHTRTLAAGTAGGNSVATYGYDAIGRKSTADLGEIGSFSYFYTGQTNQPVVRAADSGAITTLYAYEANLKDRRLKSIKHFRVGSNLLQFEYVTDELNEVVFQKTSCATGGVTAPGAWASDPESFTYDDNGRLLGRLVNNVGCQSSGGLVLHSYDYDEADNIVQAVEAGSITNFTPNSLNQISAGTGQPYAYDLAGNMLDDGLGGFTYLWDAESRPIKITRKSDGAFVEFQYDANGRRAVRKEGTQIRRYRYCGGQLCQIHDGASTNNAVVSRLFEEGEWSSSFGVMLYAQDRLRSVRALVNGTGVPLASYNYSPYGVLTSSAVSGTYGTPPLELGYAGLQRESGGWPYLAIYRGYQSKLGRWISRDPIFEGGGLNLYAYAGDNPISFTDTYGLAPEPQSPNTGSPNSRGPTPCSGNDCVEPPTNKPEGSSPKKPKEYTCADVTTSLGACLACCSSRSPPQYVKQQGGICSEKCYQKAGVVIAPQTNSTCLVSGS